ncbi:hypothetical protein HMPREF1548_00205 [Clostridium sp. KLE 1755]|nr:hypothetical protein HMPREF1548_00205 [Clostridium sp. KLE 1755]
MKSIYVQSLIINNNEIIPHNFYVLFIHNQKVLFIYFYVNKTYLLFVFFILFCIFYLITLTYLFQSVKILTNRDVNRGGHDIPGNHTKFKEVF